MVAAAVQLLVRAGAGAAAACHPDRTGDGVVTVAVLGDSNTQDGWPVPATRGWVARLAAHMKSLPGAGHAVPLKFVNAAVGATVASGDSPRPGVVANGPRQLASVLERGDVDLVIVALGTNDLYYAREPDSPLYRRSPADAWRALDGLIAAVHAAGLAALVATVPPRYDDAALGPGIVELNRLIAAHVPAGDVIDFTARFARHLFRPDGLHFNAHGQQKRARRAGGVLGRALAACDPS